MQLYIYVYYNVIYQSNMSYDYKIAINSFDLAKEKYKN